MAIDMLNLCNKKQHVRKHTDSTDPYMVLLVKLFKYLARRTRSPFNAEVCKRLMKSRTNRPVVSLSKIHRNLRRHPEKTAVVVATVVDDVRMLDVPKMSVCALRFTSSARARSEKAGGECITLDQLAVRKPTGSNTVLLRGRRSTRKACRYFGAPPGARKNAAKARVKHSKFGKKEYGRK